MTYRHVHRCHKQGQLLPLLLLLLEQQKLSQLEQMQQQLLQDEILSSIFLQGFKGIFNNSFLKAIKEALCNREPITCL
jgi:hypothetical protein